jgi:hypothetical protein
MNLCEWCIRNWWIKTLFGNVVAGEVHPQPHIWVFGNKGKIDFHWWDPPILTIAPQVWRSSILLLLSREQLLFIFFFWKTSVVNLFHPHCSREHELLIFFLFFKKISLRWIKFTRTVISILFLIIYYLILLHAQKIMKTVVLVE